MGIDPEKEKKSFRISEKNLIQGTYDLESGCVIGSDFARNLNIKVGDTLILMSKSVEGGLSAIKVTVTGIAKMGYSVFERNLVLLHISRTLKLVKSPQGAHEILVFLKRESDTQKFLRSLKLPEGLVANTYDFVLGTFSLFFKLANIIYGTIYVVITFLAAFSIINTLTVAVFERIREIGTLKSMGMTDGEIFAMFGIEGTLLGAFGGFVGSILGLFTNFILKTKGINYESLVKTFDFPFPYIIRSTTNLWIVLTAFFIVTTVSFITSVIPALYAKKLTPQEALRHI